MLTILKIFLAIVNVWLSQNTVIFNDNFPLYDSVFEKRFGHVTEQTFEGFELENDYYIIEFSDGQIHEIESDDLQIGDPVTVWFLEGVPVRMVYDYR